MKVVSVCVRLVTYKLGIRIFVTLTAGFHEVGAVDRRLRIRCRQHLMRPVAVPAMRNFGIAECRNLSMKGVPVGSVFLLVAVAASPNRLFLKRRLLRLSNTMCGMAVRTYRSLLASCNQSFAVCPRQVLRFNACMALATCRGNIRPIYRTLRVLVA